MGELSAELSLLHNRLAVVAAKQGMELASVVGSQRMKPHLPTAELSLLQTLASQQLAGEVVVCWELVVVAGSRSKWAFAAELALLQWAFAAELALLQPASVHGTAVEKN